MKKFFVNSLIIAALVASAAIVSCDKDKENPVAEGKKAAQGFCDCWKQSSFEKVKECVSNEWQKIAKYEDKNDALFWDPFINAFERYPM